MARYDCHFVGIEHLYLYRDFVLFWPDLQNILRQFTVMPQLQLTYDGCLIYQKSFEERKAFLRYDLLAKSQDCRR